MIEISEIKYVRVFLVYTGHGVTFKSEKDRELIPACHMIHPDTDSVDKITNIEKKFRKLGLQKNILVIVILDCCRIELKYKAKG